MHSPLHFWRQAFSQSNYYFCWMLQRAIFKYPKTAAFRSAVSSNLKNCNFFSSSKNPVDINSEIGEETLPNERLMKHERSSTAVAAESETKKEEGGDEMKEKLGPWRPQKRLTREKMEQMRSLRDLQPEEWTLGKLARTFGVSGAAVKRILRSKFEPSPEVEERQDRKAEEQKLRRRQEKLLSKHTPNHKQNQNNSKSHP